MAAATTELKTAVVERIVVAVAALVAIVFLPVGTFAYWQGWAWLATLLVPLAGALGWMLRHDPALLERRLHMREREHTQQRVVAVSLAWFLATFILPGLDVRFGWSHVPAAASLAADVMVCLGYLFVLRVFRENTYASRVIEVARGQRVVDTGPYARVRHPMYLGAIVMYLASPLALGSYWALLPTLLIVPLLVVRILNEERVLHRELPGYAEYARKVRWRLVPGLW